MLSPRSTSRPHPAVQYLLRLGDTCLILAQRLAEWCGHAPVARGRHRAGQHGARPASARRARVLTRAGELEAEHGGARHDEDELAFLRDERDFRNCTLVELPRGDFAVTMLRNFALATFSSCSGRRSRRSSDAELAGDRRQGGEGSALPPRARGRLGRAPRRRHRRVGGAAAGARSTCSGPTRPSSSRPTRSTTSAAASGLGPRWSTLQGEWRAELRCRCSTDAGLALPAERAFRSTGKLGRHSEHLGYLLAEMQHLQRTFPGGVW